MAEAQAGDYPPALTILANRFGLSGFEQAVLLLCVAMELDTRIPALCARAAPASPRTADKFTRTPTAMLGQIGRGTEFRRIFGDGPKD